jgi:hypothetical protein
VLRAPMTPASAGALRAVSAAHQAFAEADR